MATKTEFMDKMHQQLKTGKGMNQQEQLAAIRKKYPLTYTELASDPEGMIEKFTTELETLSGVVRVSNSPEETIKVLKELLKELDSKQVIHWTGDELAEYQLPEVLGKEGYQVLAYDSAKGEQFKDYIKDVDTGITGVKFAVAETGSIVVESGLGRERTTSLMPRYHIAIVKSSQFVQRTANVFKYLTGLKPNQIPASVNFITGPSRSADIEMDLSIGVHGPVKYCVIIEKA